MTVYNQLPQDSSEEEEEGNPLSAKEEEEESIVPESSALHLSPAVASNEEENPIDLTVTLIN